MSLTSSTFTLKTRELFYVNAISAPTQLDYRAVMTASTALVVPLTITSANKVFKLSDGTFQTIVILTEKTYTTFEEVRVELEAGLVGSGYEVTLNATNQLVFKYPSERLFVTSSGGGGSTANVILGFNVNGANTSAGVNDFRFEWPGPKIVNIFKVPPLLYATNAELLASLQSILSGSQFSAGFQDGFTERIFFFSVQYFYLVSSGGGSAANAKLGFNTSSTNPVNASSYRSYTFPAVDFYPPSTISDQHVFMRLVNAEMFGNTPSNSRIPYTISLLNVPQPVGTYTDAEKECTRSTLLGSSVAVRGVCEKGPRVLTHIPDGLQQLTFRVDQLYQNDRDFYITDNQVYQFIIEFEIASINN